RRAVLPHAVVGLVIVIAGFRRRRVALIHVDVVHPSGGATVALGLIVVIIVLTKDIHALSILEHRPEHREGLQTVFDRRPRGAVAGRRQQRTAQVVEGASAGLGLQRVEAGALVANLLE